MDPQAWINQFSGAMRDLMSKAVENLTDLLSGKAQATWQSVGASFQNSDLNFITRTPPALSYNLGGVADLYRQWDPLLTAVVALSIFFAGLSIVGREYFGWSWHPGEWGTRVLIAALMATSTMHVYILAIGLQNKILDAVVTTALPSPPQEMNDPIAGLVLTIVWIVLGMRVAWRMAYRLVYFDILLIMGPVAMMCWTIPGGQEYASFWTRTFIGLMIGQILVAVCFKLGMVIGDHYSGNWAGVALSIGVLLLAHDLATLFAEIKGGGLVSIVRSGMRAASALI